MSAMWNNPAISLHNFNDLAHHCDDFVITDGIGSGNELHERLEQISGLNLLDSALHSDCVVTSSLVLQVGSKIECRTLADTGHFNKYPILKQYLVPHPTNTIDLATLGSTAVVSHHIFVVLEIVHLGASIRCKVIIGIMKLLRCDLVLSLIVIASHYELQQPASKSSTSLSMIAAHDATQITEASPIHPQALSNWKADNYRQQLYVFEPVFLAMGNNVLQDYYSWSDNPKNIRHKTDNLFEADFQRILAHSEARSVFKSLREECDHPDLPFITDDEALIILDTIATFNPTIACLILPSHFPPSNNCMPPDSG